MTYDKLIAQNYPLPTVLGSSSFYILLLVLPHYSDIIPSFLLSFGVNKTAGASHESHPIVSAVGHHYCAFYAAANQKLLEATGELRAASRYPSPNCPCLSVYRGRVRLRFGFPH